MGLKRQARILTQRPDGGGPRVPDLHPVPGAKSSDLPPLGEGTSLACDGLRPPKRVAKDRIGPGPQRPSRARARLTAPTRSAGMRPFRLPLRIPLAS